jgi:Protein of unknown function (DUF2783)
MSQLITHPNLSRADDIYQQLVDLHQGRDEADSQRVNARLILILINHIGDADIVAQALQLAGSAGAVPEQPGHS